MIEGDGQEYEILIEACKSLTSDNLLTAEIGVRRGLGSKLILMNLKEKNHWHIGIDPYGNLNYQHYDIPKSYTSNYTNEMKQELIKDLDYKNFTLFQMGDDEFMKRFSDGVPIYREKKEIINKYDLVHFDGPHKSVDVIKESIFFGERSHKGSVFVYDDYRYYDMDAVLKIIVNEFGFMLLKQGKAKISLKRN
jgi:hypothetical protein|tara:strand:- start:105 stop:683 length:579 start_codon:yes stop_codon:yes gene_type:complete